MRVCFFRARALLIFIAYKIADFSVSCSRASGA